MKKYEIAYECELIAEVEIDDSENTQELIKEMVEFWMSWESSLEDSCGDYVDCWLKHLGLYILRYRDIPRDEEGWVPLDGTMGINVSGYWVWEFNGEDIEIKAIKKP